MSIRKLTTLILRPSNAKLKSWTSKFCSQRTLATCLSILKLSCKLKKTLRLSEKWRRSRDNSNQITRPSSTSTWKEQTSINFQTTKLWLTKISPLKAVRISDKFQRSTHVGDQSAARYSLRLSMVAWLIKGSGHSWQRCITIRQGGTPILHRWIKPLRYRAN